MTTATTIDSGSEHAQVGILQDDLGGWRVRCSCGWLGNPCGSSWRATRRHDVHKATVVLAQVAGR